MKKINKIILNYLTNLGELGFNKNKSNKQKFNEIFQIERIPLIYLYSRFFLVHLLPKQLGVCLKVFNDNQNKLTLKERSLVFFKSKMIIYFFSLLNFIRIWSRSESMAGSARRAASIQHTTPLPATIRSRCSRRTSFTANPPRTNLAGCPAMNECLRAGHRPSTGVGRAGPGNGETVASARVVVNGTHASNSLPARARFSSLYLLSRSLTPIGQQRTVPNR